jgi:hypothetical protein
MRRMIGNIWPRLRSRDITPWILNLGRDMACHVPTGPLETRQRFSGLRSLTLAIALLLSFTLLSPAPARAETWRAMSLQTWQRFSPIASRPSNAALSAAYQNRMSNLIVEGIGTVERLLPDDNIGSRHQRFIVRLNPAHTVLISHNIDLAPRLPNLREGEEVSFKGEYEWNEQGGIVHWTHRDPRGNDHPDGWIDYRGDRYD